MRDSLVEGRRPEAKPEELPCFSAQALEGNPYITPASLESVLDSLGPEDIPTLEAALEKLAAGELAWLGFKLVTDPLLAVDSEDTEVVGIIGEGAGSADALPGIFVATEKKEIRFSRQYSKRDEFQMLDITRGPHMHAEQYKGVAWLSLPLKQTGVVYIFGAGEVSHFLERMARDCDFETVVIDHDEEYLNAERLPLSHRVLVESYEELPDLGIGADDYVLVLTRGHMYDPEVITYGIKAGAHYVGMMGTAVKNEKVFEMAIERGITFEQLEETHTPIGLKFGAKTPAELALCIVAELIQVRSNRRKA
ncbi:MAG: XdhC family protein [Coriobacteriia bacterium]|nr:XdhC family protein [Coriobacteriia bacterium]